MRKTKRRIRKHNCLGKARIKYYSIKKGGEGPDSTRSRTPRSNRIRTHRSNRSRTPAQSSSPSAIKAEAAAIEAAAIEAAAIEAAAIEAAVAEATSARPSPVVRDINDSPKNNIYDHTDPIVVANRTYVNNTAVKLRNVAKEAREYAGHPDVLRARDDAHSKMLRAKMAARSLTEQMMAKAADEARVREKVMAHALRLRLR